MLCHYRRCFTGSSLSYHRVLINRHGSLCIQSRVKQNSLKLHWKILAWESPLQFHYKHTPEPFLRFIYMSNFCFTLLFNVCLLFHILVCCSFYLYIYLSVCVSVCLSIFSPSVSIHHLSIVKSISRLLYLSLLAYPSSFCRPTCLSVIRIILRPPVYLYYYMYHLIYRTCLSG